MRIICIFAVVGTSAPSLYGLQDVRISEREENGKDREIQVVGCDDSRIF